MARSTRTLLVGLAVVGAGILLAALRVNPYVYFAGYVILQYVVIATAWNILGGYAGYVNFGTPAFFALGAYTAVFLIQSTRPRHRLPDAAPQRRLLLHRDAGAVHRAADDDHQLGVRRRLAGPQRHPPERSSVRQLRHVPLRGDGPALRRGGDGGEIHRAVLGRPRARGRPGHRGGGRVHGRPHPALEALRHHRERRPARRRRRAVSLLRDLRRAHVGLQSRLRRECPGHADDRRDDELGRAGDRRRAAGDGAAAGDGDDLLRNESVHRRRGARRVRRPGARGDQIGRAHV